MAEDSKTFDPGIRKKVHELEDILCTSDHGQMYVDLEINLLSWRETKINIAVVGHSGAGKSTFINAILRLEEDEEEEAETGVIEMTKDITPFTNKNNEYVVFWDLPGVGTPAFRKKSYAKNMQLDRYDTFIILSRGRFTEEDVWLAKYVEQTKRKFYFVRTHVEEDLENDKDAHPRTHKREKVLADIKTYCRENLAKAGLEHQDVFLVDSLETDKHDFPHLSEKLVFDADGFKASILAACILTVTKSVIERKTQFLRSRIKSVAALCDKLCIDKNSRDKVDKANRLFISECALYRRMFEIDEVAVRHHQELFQLSKIEISNTLSQLCELNRSSSFLCGFTLSTYVFEEDRQMYTCVALVLFDYLRRLHDLAVDHVNMLSPEVSKKIQTSR